MVAWMGSKSSPWIRQTGTSFAKSNGGAMTARPVALLGILLPYHGTGSMLYQVPPPERMGPAMAVTTRDVATARSGTTMFECERWGMGRTWDV